MFKKLKNKKILFLPILFCACDKCEDTKKDEVDIYPNNYIITPKPNPSKEIKSSPEPDNITNPKPNPNPSKEIKPGPDPNSITNPKPSLEGTKPTPNDLFMTYGVRGLPNCGNSCYLNSSIQQLYNIKPVYDAISNAKLPDNDSENKTKLEALQSLLVEMKNSKGDFNPADLCSKLGHKMNQEDASEFLRSLLNLCANNTPWEFIIESICKYGDGLFKSESTYTENILSLTIKKDKLKDCLNDYFAEDKCDNGDTKQYLLMTLPEVLFISLDRFKFDPDSENKKTNKRVEFPFVLDIDKNWCVDDLEEQKFSYELVGVIVHSGSSSGGHYWSYVKKDEKWFKFDDLNVYEVGDITINENVLNELYGDSSNSKSAYILIYQKNTTA